MSAYTESAWQLGNDAFWRGEPFSANPWLDRYDPNNFVLARDYNSWSNGWDWGRQRAQRPAEGGNSGSGVTKHSTE